MREVRYYFGIGKIYDLLTGAMRNMGKLLVFSILDKTSITLYTLHNSTHILISSQYLKIVPKLKT
jgi:hypothetical protein